MNPTENSEPQTTLVDRHQLFSPDHANSPATTAEQSAVGKQRKILVVDDDRLILRAFETKLKGCGFDVQTATDSSSAIAAARLHKPELVILDINFSTERNFSSLQWDGMNVLQWFKRFHEVADIPIIVVSGEEPAKYQAKVLTAGGRAYFQKPVDLRKFTEALLEILANKTVTSLNPEI